MPNSKPPPKLSKVAIMTLLIGVLALCTGAVGVYRLIERDDAVAQPETGMTVPVLVANQDLATGTSGAAIVDEGLYDIIPTELVNLPADPVVDPAQLVGRNLAAPKSSGDAFVLTELNLPLSGAEIEVPEGMEAVAVTLPFDPAVAGYVKAGDTVTVYAVVQEAEAAAVTTIDGLTVDGRPEDDRPSPVVQTILNDVVILDVSNDLAPRYETQVEARPAVGQITYLMALEPADAARIIYAVANESIYLTLAGDESPGDRVSIARSDLLAEPPGTLAAADIGPGPGSESEPTPGTDEASDPPSGTLSGSPWENGS